MTDTEKFERIEKEAQTLMDAAAVLEKMSGKSDKLDVSGKPDISEEERRSTTESLEKAAEVCKALSLSQTLTLVEHGYIPDLQSPDDRDLLDDDDDDDDDMPSATFH